MKQYLHTERKRKQKNKTLQTTTSTWSGFEWTTYV